jgi:hypothetical protein
MNIIPVLLSVGWLLNIRVALSQEPVVMLRQGTVRGVSVSQVRLFWHLFALKRYVVEEVKETLAMVQT